MNLTPFIVSQSLDVLTVFSGSACVVVSRTVNFGNPIGSLALFICSEQSTAAADKQKGPQGMSTFPHLLASLEPFEKKTISQKHLQNVLLVPACASVRRAGTAAAVPASTAKQKRLIIMLAQREPKGK